MFRADGAVLKSATKALTILLLSLGAARTRFHISTVDAVEVVETFAGGWRYPTKLVFRQWRRCCWAL